MGFRTRHGNAKNHNGPTDVLETLPVEELPAGVPADARSESPGDRRERGRFAAGNTLARLGGQARKGKARLVDRLGLRSLPDDSLFRPYKASAVAFRRTTCAELARTVGAGVCGPIPSSFVASAALALAWSRFYFDAAADTLDADMVSLASKLSDASSSLLRQASEYCAKEAIARSKQQPQDLGAVLLAAAAGDRKEPTK